MMKNVLLEGLFGLVPPPAEGTDRSKKDKKEKEESKHK